jgi:hypothetical protein
LVNLPRIIGGRALFDSYSRQSRQSRHTYSRHLPCPSHLNICLSITWTISLGFSLSTISHVLMQPTAKYLITSIQNQRLKSSSLTVLCIFRILGQPAWDSRQAGVPFQKLTHKYLSNKRVIPTPAIFASQLLRVSVLAFFYN